MKAIKVKPVLFKEGNFAYPIMNNKSLERLNYAKNELAARSEKKQDKRPKNKK